jgi:hypothetical protein
MVTDKRENYPMLKRLKMYIGYVNGFIAGGCFRSIFDGVYPKDIDIFFHSQADFDFAVEAYREEANWKVIYENENATGFYKKGCFRVDLVRSIFGSPEEIISQFDFTVAKFAMDDERVVYADTYWRDLHLKRLVCDDKIPMPIGTFERTQRYAKYGYFMCRETKIKLLQAIRETAMSDIETSKSLYQGWD